MCKVALTDNQRAAVESLGQDVIVRASAGSGKTTVLTLRCVYLACDAPPPFRCPIDRLLVLTFTDAAAAEMRVRIAEALRARLATSPNDSYLQEQVDRVPAAQISTIHAYCGWLIRRWFNELDIDPGATVMDAEQATLLKRQVLEDVFAQYYRESATSDARPLGAVTEAANKSQDMPPAAGFVRLVEEYGLGKDRKIGGLILRMSAFLESLADPETWLAQSVRLYTDDGNEVLRRHLQSCACELGLQMDHCEKLFAAFRSEPRALASAIDALQTYMSALSQWNERLTAAMRCTRRPGDSFDAFEEVRDQIAGFKLPIIRTPSKLKERDPIEAARWNHAKRLWEPLKEQYFPKRLRARFAKFSVRERREDMQRVAWAAKAICDSVRLFRTTHEQRKRAADLLDFDDMQRLAFRLLAAHNTDEDSPHVAATLHERFQHVLVDEFQDVNPLQDAIIRRSSHELLAGKPGNLFVVGDIKQSIYRFRLAEPEVFADRWARCKAAPDRATAITLRTNFRSDPRILIAINEIFSRLMPAAGAPVTYDPDAYFVPGRNRTDAPLPTELHVFESNWTNDVDESPADAELGIADPRGPAYWSALEREAYWIAQRIQKLVTRDRAVAANEPAPTNDRIGYGDIVVLLRSAKINAERVAAMLNTCGVPAQAAVAGALLSCREVRDVIAVLRVVDNVQQDIPLAAVLRNRVLGIALNENEFVEIRCHDRRMPFCEAVRAYAEQGSSAPLRKRLRLLLDRIDKLRRSLRDHSVPELVAEIQHRFGYGAYVGGLPNGLQRRANLHRFQQLARTFGQQQQPYLHRFVRFIDGLLEQDEAQPSEASPPNPAGDAVRVMTIHQSKGLEFPVVFLAGLGTKFNLGDAHGDMLFERHSHLGLKVVDNDRAIEYPTAAHTQTVMEVEQAARDEELRILYVAMTRARDRLILTGARRNAAEYLERDRSAASAPGADAPESNRPQQDMESPTSRPSALTVATANTPLDWLIPAISSMPEALVAHDAPGAGTAIIALRVHEVDEMRAWHMPQTSDAPLAVLMESVARGEPLPDDAPRLNDTAAVDRLAERLRYRYPSLAVTSLPAAVGASEVKRLHESTNDQVAGHTSPLVASPSQTVAKPGPGEPRRGQLSRELAAQRGIVTHRVLQVLDFAVAAAPNGVTDELKRMVAGGAIAAADAELVDADAISWFAGTPLADEIRAAGDAYAREFQYIAAQEPSQLDSTIAAAPDDFVLIRGIVDGAWLEGEGLAIVDFKTDAVTAEEVEQRAAHYYPQMRMYVRAMEGVWRKRVERAYLVFLAAREIVEVADSVRDRPTI